eukprot:3789579-Pyramimonas_sp.AAC.1
MLQGLLGGQACVKPLDDGPMGLRPNENGPDRVASIQLMNAPPDGRVRRSGRCVATLPGCSLDLQL